MHAVHGATTDQPTVINIRVQTVAGDRATCKYTDLNFLPYCEIRPVDANNGAIPWIRQSIIIRVDRLVTHQISAMQTRYIVQDRILCKLSMRLV